MAFDTTTIDSLTFYNSGASRSRLTLIAPAGEPPGRPRQVAGTRWIVFGEEAGQQLHALIDNHSMSQLRRLLAPVGGLSAGTFSQLRNRWQLEEPEQGAWEGCRFINFGQGNSRVLLIGPLGDALEPERIGDTSIVALNPAARQALAAYLETLPGSTSLASAAADEVVPGGLAGKTLVRARQATSGPG